MRRNPVVRRPFSAIPLLRGSGPTALSARTVNVAILLLLWGELTSGLGGFLVGAPDGRWLFWFHRAGGLGLVVLLVWKTGIAARSYRRRGLGVGTGLSALGGVLFLGSLATGLLWATVGLPRVPVPIFGSWTVLSLHVALSLLLIPLFLIHVGLRWPQPRRADLIGRRATLRLLVLLATGLALWRIQELFSAPRRFTGSREEASFAGNLHPVTNWLTDPIPRIDRNRWRLRVRGEVEREISLSYEQALDGRAAVRRAALDCTAAGTRSSAGAVYLWPTSSSGPESGTARAAFSFAPTPATHAASRWARPAISCWRPTSKTRRSRPDTASR